MALPVNGSTHLIPAYYSFYQPRKDERVSWPSWLTCSGWLTHISGHPSAAGQVQDRESSPARDRRSTTVPRHQPNCWLHLQYSCHSIWQYRPFRRIRNSVTLSFFLRWSESNQPTPSERCNSWRNSQSKTRGTTGRCEVWHCRSNRLSREIQVAQTYSRQLFSLCRFEDDKGIHQCHTGTKFYRLPDWLAFDVHFRTKSASIWHHRLISW